MMKSGGEGLDSGAPWCWLVLGRTERGCVMERINENIRTLVELYRKIQPPSAQSALQDSAYLATAWNILTLCSGGVSESGHGEESPSRSS